MPPLTNQRHEAFALNYFGGQISATEAAIKAGYSAKSAHVTASRLLRNAKVLARIQELRTATTDEAVADVLERKLLLTQIIRSAIMADYLTPDGHVDADKARNGLGVAAYRKRTLADNSITEMIRLRDPVKCIKELNKMDGIYPKEQPREVPPEQIRFIEAIEDAKMRAPLPQQDSIGTPEAEAEDSEFLPYIDADLG